MKRIHRCYSQYSYHEYSLYELLHGLGLGDSLSLIVLLKARGRQDAMEHMTLEAQILQV